MTNQPLSFVAQELISKATLFEERNKVYKDTYKRIGEILAILLRDQPIDIQDATGLNRIACLVQVVGKITRYCQQFSNGGHMDSLDDLSVYAMMLKDLDNQAWLDACEQAAKLTRAV